MADEGGWVWQMATLRRQFPGLPLVSGYRAGAVTAGSGKASYHSRGRAVDVPPRMDVFEWIRTNYPNSRELIYSPAGSRQIYNGQPHVYTGVTKADHYSHVHWAIVDQTTGGTVSAGILEPVDTALNLANNIGKFVAFFTDPGNWARIGMGVGGALLLLFGFLAMTRNSIDIGKVVSSGTR